MTRFPKLLVHIGPGKTGSTSIQSMLSTEREKLRDQGVVWLGMMLEDCPNQPQYDWQSGLQPALLFEGIAPGAASDQVYQALRQGLEHLSTMPVRYAVWSHEAIFARRQGVGDALRRLQEDVVDIHILCYLRRHDHWAKSAYAQWGIKHKTYSGPVMPFSDWVQDRPVRFAQNLQYWQGEFGQSLDLRNFDQTADVTADVLDILGVTGCAGTRVYETPSTETLAAWAIYNSQYTEPVLPARFQRLLNLHQSANGSVPLPECERLFASDADFENLLKDAADDLRYINSVLREKGQPEFDTDQPATWPHIPSEWEMIQFLAKSVFALHEQALRLRQRIDVLEQGDLKRD